MAAEAGSEGLVDHPWAEAIMPSTDVVTCDLGDQRSLFHEDRQQLVTLNETAAAIWQGLLDGWSYDDITAGLCLQGVGRDLAARYVSEMFTEWLAGGWAYPQVLTGYMEQPSQPDIRLSILDIGFSLFLHGRHIPDGLNAVIAPLRGEVSTLHRLDVAAWAGGFFLAVDQRWRGFFSALTIVPAVKAALTQRLTRSVTHGFLAHGALLERSGMRIFLSGPPGSGKSTLAMALLDMGFCCLSDDIVQFDDLGRTRGAPFAPTLKSGSWVHLPRLAATLEAAPIHQRADGQRVRYAPAAISPGLAREIDIFVVLERHEDGPIALGRLSGLAAMEVLLRSSFAATGGVSGIQVKALSGLFSRVSSHRLRFSHLGEACTVIRQLSHAQA